MTEVQLFNKPVQKRTLADQLVDEIKKHILCGDLESGAALPSEAELAEQYGVSRAVVRDATRLLKAQGLIRVEHGRGAFVTPVQNSALSDAFRLSLQRIGATAWDVEQFEQLLFPEIVYLAAAQATDSDCENIRKRVVAYLDAYAAFISRWEEEVFLAEVEQMELRKSLLHTYRSLIEAIFAATHNKVIEQLALPLLQLRNVREWSAAQPIYKAHQELETAYFRQLIDAIERHDSTRARGITRKLMEIPPEAVEAMKKTPAGDIPLITRA
jgi:DNA-binding FadR family transcriptional regulator